LAKENPQAPIAVEALAWIVLHKSNRGDHWDDATWHKAENILLRDYLASDRLPMVFDRADSDSLSAVLEKCPNRKSCGLACFEMVERHISHVRTVSHWRRENPDWQQLWKQLWYRRMPAYFASFVTTDIEQETKETETLLKRIMHDFADIPIPDRRNGKTLGDLAKGHLHEIRDLGVGKPAPALGSVDLDGKPVKLADMKGKVVVLDIWATWCGPCCAMIPHERELVKRLAGKPFVLVSIGVDDSRETVAKFLEKKPMPWTHWFNGPDGSIVADLNVVSFPTIYVLDDKGVIRCKDVRGELLDRTVDTLLNAIEGPATQK
jgi:thiol-disulfide isomerase/thioredoxin